MDASSSGDTRVQRRRAGKHSQNGEGGPETTTPPARQERSKVQIGSRDSSTGLSVAPPINRESGKSLKTSHPETTAGAANCAASSPPSPPSSASAPGKPPLGPSTLGREPLPKIGQIMVKVNTYPTPDSSPKSQTTSSPSMSGRSSASPAGFPEVTRRHVERVNSKMNSILESIEATGCRSHPLNEGQMEVDPLPRIFCGPTASSSSTVNDSWVVGGEISDNDPEVINSIDDLERALDDCLPNPSDPVEDCEGSEKDPLLKPENAPMLAMRMPRNPPPPLRKPQLHTSHSLPEGNAHSLTQRTQRGNLAAARDHGRPKSDSGIGSTQGSPGNAFLYKEYKGLDYEGSGQLFFGELPPCGTGNPVGAEGGRSGSLGSTPCAVEVSEAAANYSAHHQSSSQFHDIQASYGSTSFHYGEPTPPSSAIRSPSAYPPFGAHDFLKTEQLSSESVDAMVGYILEPILRNGAFKDFWHLCKQAKCRLLQGKICWLRDLEKFLFDGVPAVRSLSSYKAFCEAILDNCQRALPYIRESDQQRSYDPVYSPAYFIDALHHAKELADAWTAEKNKVVREARHNCQSASEELDTSRNNKSKLKDFVLPPDMISPEGRKRQMPIDFNQDESQMKRALTPNKVAGSVRPGLAIQTSAPLGYYDGYHGALPPSPLQAENIGYPLNPGFDFGPTALTAVQSGRFAEYTHPSSEPATTTTTAPLPSDVSGDNRVMPRHPAGYPQAPTPADTNYAGSPMAPAPLFEGPSGNSHSTPGRKASVPAGKPDEEDTPIYYCDQCNREFPRPCDLTKHKKTHERPFKCDDESCKYHIEGFPTNKERERHQNDIHVANSKEWNCMYSPCTYKSKRESNCKQHMEKAHGYTYKRMKRNPRKRPEQLTKPVASDKRKRGSVRKTSVATSRSTVSKVTKTSRPSQSEAPGVAALPRQDPGVAVSTGFDSYQSYHQSSSMHGINDYQLIDPGMHGTPYFDGSPTTDFEPSPVTAPMGYNPHINTYETNHSVMENSEWYSSQDSGFLDPFLPDFGQSSTPYDEGVGDDDTAD
ncbi:unnamed protein product [Tuber aestivum]|uniref:C2H2-type domain-containing protein n=1 Tax=Tuber aestivum TaxID=59557 RepID=A0A292PYD1_9PEZI|nr:unnamed protein product [Tuber aestivum]